MLVFRNLVENTIMMYRNLSLISFFILFLPFSSCFKKKEYISDLNEAKNKSALITEIFQVNDTALSEGKVESLLRPIYDTLNLKPFEEESDSIALSYSQILRFSLGNRKYAAMAVENRHPFYGASTGHCDFFVFTFDGTKWKISDLLLQAGGGGMYGNPGSFDGIVKTGINSFGFVVSGGQTHMGTHYYDDIVIFENSKLKNLLQITTNSSYGDWEEKSEENPNRYCEDISYKFLPSDKQYYDLKLSKSSCLPEDKEKIIEEKVIAYDFKAKKYLIPDSFTDDP